MKTSASLFGQVAIMVVVFGAVLTVVAGAVLSLDDSATSLGLTNVLPDYAVGLVWALVILASIRIWPVPPRHKSILMVLWIARIGLTLGVMLFYEGYYGLDAGYYFSEGVREPAPWELLSFGSGNDNMVALVGLHNMAFPTSYHATKVTCALIGLVAVYLIYRAACLYYGQDYLRLLYLLGLFPSIMFWGSILGKDPITLLGIAIFVYAVVAYTMKGGVRFIVWGVLGIALAAFIRVWLAMIFVLPLGVVLMFGRIGIIRRILLFAVILVGGTLSVQEFADHFEIAIVEDLVSTTDLYSQAFARGGSGQEISGGFSSVGSIVAFVPLGGFTALFRPLPGEVINPFGLMAGLENALLLWLLIRSVIAGNLRRLTEPLVAWAAVTILVWAAVYGLISYQNLGTAFRFKLQVMPLLLLLLLYLGHRFGSREQRAGESRPIEYSRR